MAADPKLLMDAATKLQDVASKLGIIERVKSKLMMQPDVAAIKLTAILAELQKTLLALQTEVVNFISITPGPGPELKAAKTALFNLEGHMVRWRMQTARTHCRRIGNIYRNYLDPWFQRVTHLNAAERQEMHELFQDLSDVDGQLVALLDIAAKWLGDAAIAVGDLLEQSKIDEANSMISATRHQLLPVQIALSQSMTGLLNLEAEFIESTRVS